MDDLRAYEIIVDTVEMIGVIGIGVAALLAVGRWFGRMGTKVDNLTLQIVEGFDRIEKVHELLRAAVEGHAERITRLEAQSDAE